MLRKCLVLSALAGSVVLCTSFALFAQETAILPEDRDTFTIEAVTDVPMRKKPPNAGYIFIYSPGDMVAVIKAGEKVKVQRRKIVKTFFGNEVWVRVKRIEQEKKPEGWIYWGSEEASQASPDFRRVKKGE